MTKVDVGLPNSRNGETKPRRRGRSERAVGPTSLSHRQLAAARLLACGRHPLEVARELGITRQALWKWRRRADFDAELFRLHECLTWTAGATRGRTAPPR